MYQLNNERFGTFLNEMRKEKNLTQKELGDILFVSDKTVSKWERGASMPNVALLMPIAEVLDVTVTELLKGEKINREKGLPAGEVENLIMGSLDLSVNNKIRLRKRIWILVYLLCVFITAGEIVLLIAQGLSLWQMRENILIVCGLTLVFSGWFCFFAKDLLPAYYDGNKINYVASGFIRLHLIGLSFNNGNWTYLCTAFKVCMLSISVLYPLSGCVSLAFGGIALWDEVKNIIFAVMAVIWLAVIYIVGKRYE